MTATFVVTGTDTGVGKTVLSAALVALLDGYYWKPVQAGTAGGTDSDRVQSLSGLGPDRMLPEAQRLRRPASPHLAAAAEKIQITRLGLELPQVDRPLVIEGAGGVLVPLSRDLMQIDVFASWEAPVIVCARTRLGTINHTLLTLEALRRRRVPVHGVAFVGAARPDVEATICDLGKVTRLGRLPRLKLLDKPSLMAAFRAGFDIGDFLSGVR